ncbi:hypothetical protein SDC9_12479 [bioreactor metagenome]|uniref:Uncharacterized protein n=1 Tax=bioreactor metagenome TaxID=1076179 RepID=A0A644TM53_9ZZZZ|nr:hypothetical protein [Desulfovibrio desulfuricans]MEA4991089.1 hypothetical protein [Desulfovibrio desulfuricans]
MPNIFFNTEIGQAASMEAGKQALLQAADIFYKMNKHCSTVYRECHDAGLICLIRDGNGFTHSIKDCIRSIPKDSLSKVMLMIHGLDRGSVIDTQCYENIADLTVDQLDVQSPLMEYAARKNGMLLTIAVTEDWKHNFFTFREEASLKLPNLWGQDDVSPFEQWITNWYKKYISPITDLLRRCEDLIICPRALPEVDFTPQEWSNIAQHFERARERDYAVDNNLIKNLLPNHTKYSPLFELRLLADGIRVLFSLQEHKPIVGGYYRYGTGESKVRDDNSRTAITRINAYTIN